jgi:hypothetical protein
MWPTPEETPASDGSQPSVGARPGPAGPQYDGDAGGGFGSASMVTLRPSGANVC